MGNKIFMDNTYWVDFNRPGSRTQTVFQTTVSDDYWITSQYRQLWRPPTDVYETAEAVEVRVEIPGVNEEDLAISFSEQRLRIAGVRKDPAMKQCVHRMEISYGDFATEVLLRQTIDASKMTATYREGFLNIYLPKSS